MHHIRVCRAHLEVHVGVEDPGGKAHSGRRERVGVGHLNLQPKRAALKGRVGRSLLMMLLHVGLRHVCTLIHAVQLYMLDSDGSSLISGLALLFAALNSWDVKCLAPCQHCRTHTYLEQPLPCCHVLFVMNMWQSCVELVCVCPLAPLVLPAAFARHRLQHTPPW